MTLLIAPSIEALLVTYLSAELPVYGLTMRVASRVPNPRPSESVVIFRSGGTYRDLVTDVPQVTVEVRARMEQRAESIIGVVRALLLDLEGRDLSGHAVYQVEEFSGPANLPDPISGVRYTMTLSIAVRADARVELVAGSDAL